MRGQSFRATNVNFQERDYHIIVKSTIVSIDTIQYYGYETNHVIPYISIENWSSILVSRI